MKKLLLFITIFCALKANAQPFSISFAGTGLSTVKVQNLKTGVIVDVPAGDVLLLSTATGIPEFNNLKSSGLKVYPNPMTDKSTLEIFPPVSGDVIISVCDMTGKVLTQYKGYVENYAQEFSLSGIKNGLHIITVQGNGYRFSEKLLSNGKSTGTVNVVKISNNIQPVAEKKSIMNSKGVQGNVNMTYSFGERLKYTAESGYNKTVMTDIPAENKTVTFTFTECKDGDNNNYPVVQIGTQLWMAENLNTTRYNDRTAIPLVSDNVKWAAATTGAYCGYNTTYGSLYNFYVIDYYPTKKNVCPISWHVPRDDEWTTLTSYLDGLKFAGGQLKETGTTHWRTPNTGATNKSGFTALPGGYRRYDDGSFIGVGQDGYWWSSNIVTPRTNGVGIRYVNHLNASVGDYAGYQTSGYSIRCVRDF